uniref:RT_RNaseH domain-containing protein n=1 Tax=Trichuris muris TaxID=70415 RepID=A0A5S6QU65_TRIMR
MRSSSLSHSPATTCYSEGVRPLNGITTFPMPTEAQIAFQQLKKGIETSAVQAIDESLPFELENDASDAAIGAVLSQLGRPMAFFARTFQPHEKRYAAVEKEAQAIIEAVRHWKHFLTGRHFTTKTDQRSVNFVFDKRHSKKIKNDKMRWKMELCCLDFDIIHLPGRDNIPPDSPIAYWHVTANMVTPAGSTLLKKHVRLSKADPLVEVELLQANPMYAYVRFPDGRESTVSIRHLSPAESPSDQVAEICNHDENPPTADPLEAPNEDNNQSPQPQVPTETDSEAESPSSDPVPTENRVTWRRSTRTRRPPVRLDL